MRPWCCAWHLVISLYLPPRLLIILFLLLQFSWLRVNLITPPQPILVLVAFNGCSLISPPRFVLIVVAALVLCLTLGNISISPTPTLNNSFSLITILVVACLLDYSTPTYIGSRRVQWLCPLWLSPMSALLFVLWWFIINDRYKLTMYIDVLFYVLILYIWFVFINFVFPCSKWEQLPFLRILIYKRMIYELQTHGFT